MFFENRAIGHGAAHRMECQGRKPGIWDAISGTTRHRPAFYFSPNGDFVLYTANQAANLCAPTFGEVAEWSKAPDSKSDVG